MESNFESATKLTASEFIERLTDYDSRISRRVVHASSHDLKLATDGTLVISHEKHPIDPAAITDLSHVAGIHQRNVFAEVFATDLATASRLFGGLTARHAPVDLTIIFADHNVKRILFGLKSLIPRARLAKTIVSSRPVYAERKDLRAIEWTPMTPTELDVSFTWLNGSEIAPADEVNPAVELAMSSSGAIRIDANVIRRLCLNRANTVMLSAGRKMHASEKLLQSRTADVVQRAWAFWFEAENRLRRLPADRIPHETVVRLLDHLKQSPFRIKDKEIQRVMQDVLPASDLSVCFWDLFNSFTFVGSHADDQAVSPRTRSLLRIIAGFFPARDLSHTIALLSESAGGFGGGFDR